MQSILCACALLVAACAGGDLDELTPDQGRITRPDLGGEDPDLGGGGADLGAPDQSQPGEDQGAGGACSPLAKDCPADKKCVLDSNAQAFCMQRGVDRPAGDPCDGIHQCASGTLCVVWGDATVGRCETVCDPDAAQSTCPMQGPCTSRVGGRTDFGLCASGAVPCDLGLQDCAGGEACVLRYDDQAGGNVTRCGRPGTLVESAPCGAGVMGTCGRGLFCLSVNGGGSECTRACTPGVTPTQCSAGSTCTGRTDSGVDYCVR